MDGFKEFNGKDLDNAIEEACTYFDAPREKLEIEIIQDSKSGIFGIVGARKAKIRARRAPLRETVQSLLGKKHEEYRIAHKSKPAAVERQEEEPVTREKSRKKSKPNVKNSELSTSLPASVQPLPAKSVINERCSDLEDEIEELPVRSMDELDYNLLEKLVEEVVDKLVTPVAGQSLPIKVDVTDGRIRARVEWSGDAGLLIGREGQTLQAIQYLASRLVSRGMNAALRVQLDIGEYRARQEDKLRGMAKMLAEKARQSGKSFSTRPLSSYHRRIIHLYLQDMQDITTRSSGDLPLKRVVISSRRPEKS